MENFTLRFPLVTQKLLEQLDNENLAKSRKLSRILKSSLDNNKLLWIRIVKKYVRQERKFKKSWDLVFSKVSLEIAKELALAVKSFFKDDNFGWKRRQAWEVWKKRQEWAPLHISAFHGNVFLHKYVTEKTGQINPKSDDGETPLHYAAEEGNLEIFKLIFENVDDKNPISEDGESPLEIAKNYGHSEIEKFISEHVQG